VIAGAFCFLLLNGIPFIIRKISRDKILPADYKRKEAWATPSGSIVPNWLYVLRICLFSSGYLPSTPHRSRKVIGYKNRHGGVQGREIVLEEVKNGGRIPEGNEGSCEFKISDGQS
jgi:hypothetical protein